MRNASDALIIILKGCVGRLVDVAMDASGAMLAYEIAQGRVATIAVTGITFFQPRCG